MGKIQLYHFTKEEHLPSILFFGINRGDVPLYGPDPAFSAPNLTSDGDVNRQEWGQNTNRIRITVELDESDPRLWKWRDLTRALRGNLTWIKIANETGGKGEKSWYVYLGTILPDNFAEVKDMNTGRIINVFTPVNTTK